MKLCGRILQSAALAAGITNVHSHWAVNSFPAKKWLKYENKPGDRMIKQLLNLVITKYHDLSVSRRSVICLNK